jgi:hypothetical protein
MPSRRHSSAIECSPRKPSSTMRIFSRRMSLTIPSDGDAVHPIDNARC